GWLVALALTFAAPALPCSRVEPMPAPEALIRRASVIVLATAAPSTLPDAVEFRVNETLKGTVPTPLLVIQGQLTPEDDDNDSPFPFAFVRRGGRHGNCFATTYRAGRAYVLMLNPANQTNRPSQGAFVPTLTPYWEPLAPTNEQVSGASDRWVKWVRSHCPTVRK